MNIVLIDKSKKNKVSFRNNIDFLSKLSLYCNVNVVPVFDKKGVFFPVEKVLKEYKPDVLICNSHSHYLQEYFKKAPCLKVMVAVDARKLIENDREDYYKKNKFDIIFRRGANKEYFKKAGVETIWLPWCADEEEFFPGNKKESLIFIGTSSKAYPQRRQAIMRLEKHNLLTNYGKIISSDYSKKIREARVLLTSAETLSPFAKVFEGAASKTSVLTPPFLGEEVLFKKGSFFKYKSNCSNIVEVAKEAIESSEQKALGLYRCFLEHHTTKKRIQELYFNIKRLLEGKHLIHKWEI